METFNFFELWTTEPGNHIKFLKKFYDLGLQEKYAALDLFNETIFNDYVSYERIVRAILQHSPKASRDHYPCKGVRKLSLAAKLADEKYNLTLCYGIEKEINE